MITIDEKNELKVLLGSRFAKDVQAILLQKEVYVNGVETYSPSHISNVLNGTYENADIEAAIYEVYEERKAKAELLEQRKSTLLSNKKKPVSGHSAG